MKVINYLLVLLFLFSLTSQGNIDGEIKKNLISKIKTLLEERDSFNYGNDILSPNNTIDRYFIIDKVELDKIDLQASNYKLEAKAREQIRTALFASQPNVYNDFHFSLNSHDLNQILDYAIFTEYIGCTFRQDNIISYVIFRLSVNMKLNAQYQYTKRCVRPDIADEINIVKDVCQNDPVCERCRVCSYELSDDYYKCNKNTIFTIYKRRPLNDTEKLEANNLVSAYSAEVFNLMIEEVEKESIIVEKKAEMQASFHTGQIFESPNVKAFAKITEYGDIEIKFKKYIRPAHHFELKIKAFYSTKCLKIANEKFLKKIIKNEEMNYNLLISKGWCKRDIPCEEKKSEYLIADKDGESSCLKLKELKKEKKNINMEIYNDGSMAIREATSGGILFYAKPNIQGKGPFRVGVSRDLELQIIDSKNVVVWKSTPTYIRRY